MNNRTRFWSIAEDKIIRTYWKAETDPALTYRLPGRSAAGIASRRRFLGLHHPRGGTTMNRVTHLSAKKFLKKGRLSSGMHPPTPEATPEALAERDRIANAPRTIGMLLLGDPPPGRSALDKMRAEQASQNDLHKLSSRHPAWSPRAW